MPDRVQRRDAWILKRQLNCNFVRCSHYPQSPAFLNACDELGLLVWEEIPGWHYLGDARWRKQALRDVRKMIVRDRNHPSIVVWGVRVNESRDDPLHKRMERMAGKFDPTRPTSGAAPSGKHTRSGWMHDIYGQNDYKRDADTNSVAIRRPLAGIPYLVTESVGQRDYAGGTGFTQRYGRGANPKMQYRQALFHAQAHDRAAGSNIAGLIGWCAFDYQSVRNDNDTGLKRPGVMDCFRETKLGASIYRSQVDPATKAVIEPNFYWYFRDPTTNGPGDGAMICSNCDRLEIYVDNQHHSSLEPARHKFPRLPFAPFFADLGSVDRKGDPQLRIDGYVAGKLVRRRLLSSDPAFDHLVIKLDDDRIRSDGVDATRLAIRIVDKYGTIRGLKGGKVDLAISGPGVLIGPQEFNLTPNGGVGAVWIRSRNGRGGTIKIVASHKKYDPVSTKLVSR